MHAPVTAKSGDAELKLAGKADVVEDQSLRTKLDDLFWQMIAWRPAPDSHYFEILAQRAAFVTYDGSGQIAIRWQTGGDEHAHIAPAFDVAHVVPYPAKVMLLGIVIERMPVGGRARFTGPRGHR